MVYGPSHLAGVDFKEDIVLCEVPFGGVLFLNNLIPHRRFVSSLFSLFDFLLSLLSFLSLLSLLSLLFFVDFCRNGPFAGPGHVTYPPLGTFYSIQIVLGFTYA